MNTRFKLQKVYMIIRLCIVFSLIFAASAHADIYRYVDENGVECFTDSPVNKNAVLVMKESPDLRKSAPEKANKPGKRETHIAVRGKGASDNSCLAGNLPVQGRITSVVGMRHDPIDGTLRFHNGIDIAIPEGTPVKPIAAGIVLYSGERHGYGNIVVVEHPDGMRTIYAHNSANLVSPGEQVDSDTVIAFSGSTGRSTGPHLHFEAWRGEVNVTSDFLGYGGGDQLRPAIRVTAGRQRVRTAVLPDGSTLFTNLPYVHP